MLSVGLVCLCYVTLAEAFLFLGDNEPVLYCIKICPLYCSPKRRHDEDASSLIYDDEPPYPSYHHEDHGYHSYHDAIPYHFDPYYYCKPPKPTTTTPAPTTTTTTTPEPTLICMICMNKCTKYPKAKKS
ncbi:uncharacterized protein LOC112045321 [Bicyclus anynana]|uniref:Uncharacterized protein LOC112045321 n=1 Tax=Bicyclus anynana TaxID=110368 RepID=A0ABM3LWB3_BICAN|nr:uncharacterized protein LOC112045321 [Bicyclus anynana]